MSQFIEMFYGMETTPVKDYIDDSFPGEWGTEDKDGNGVKVIRTTNFTNSGKLNLADVVTRSIEDRKVARKQIKKYDTILERSGGTADNPVGRVVLFEEDDLFLCNNFTQVLRFKNIDPRFAFYSLYYFYQTSKTAIRSMGSKTTGIQNLNMGKYQEIGVPNASDEQQKAFVSIAEQADKSEFVGCKSQFIEMFKDSHSKVQIKDICYVVSGKSIPSKLEDIEGSNPYVKVADFNIPGNEKYITTAQRYVSDDSASYSKLIPKGSVLFAKNGAASMSNKKRLTKIQCCIDMNTMAIIPKNGSILSDFLFATIESMDIASHVRQGAIPSISPKSIEDSYIVIPTKTEQCKYISLANQADKSEYYN